MVNKINFASSDDIHTMALVYESMLGEVRDTAGDSGEFYTPRPIIRFMGQQVDAKLGEIVLDPACGPAASWSKRSGTSSRTAFCDDRYLMSAISADAAGPAARYNDGMCNGELRCASKLRRRQ